jgi:hypothetical protein
VKLPDGSVDPNTLLGPQRFGWFNHFLVAYIDGGYVPTTSQTVPGMMGAPDQTLVVASEMTLFAPNTWTGADGNPTGCNPATPTDPAAPCIGQGFDVIAGVNGASGARGQAGYSPLCHVMTYTPTPGGPPATDPDNVQGAGTLDMDTGTYVYCLQVAQ